MNIARSEEVFHGVRVQTAGVGSTQWYRERRTRRVHVYDPGRGSNPVTEEHKKNLLVSFPSKTMLCRLAVGVPQPHRVHTHA